MALTEQEVRHIALLSRLKLSDDEVRLYREQLAHILGYVEKLRMLDTNGIEPMISASVEGNVFRADEPRPGLERTDALQSAPSHDDEYFRVPNVME